MATGTKPLILACCLHQDGHFGPIATISKALIDRGYEVTIYTGSPYREKTKTIGASFLPLPGKADWTERSLFMSIPRENHKDFFQPPGPGFNAAVWEHMQVGMIPDQHAGIQDFLIDAKGRGREVIILHECTFWGALPSLLGAGIPPLGVISIGIQPLALSSPEIPPFGSGLKYDASSESHERNRNSIMELFQGPYSVPDQRFQVVVEALGGKKSPYHVLDAQVRLPDRYLQLCVPGLDNSTEVEYPEWWSEITETKKPVVVVCGGTTINIPYQNLIVPTMQGLADEDVIVVVLLGCSGAKLPSEITIPENARVIDYSPYDETFPHADVFVNHGGYGGLQHAMSHGLPVVTATGITDKSENAARAEWAGAGVSLETNKPSPEQVKVAVKKVISDPSYRQKSREIGEEMTKFDAIKIVVENIEELSLKN
ncbi:glycosyltransferase family 1 protein [Hyaloscypha variabilis F]|uniref:Glycosyltransferase family 1 protein n=1 Tax=Hyaloscypha variabilis (strain UAMH 11265 / GT02V1 / F) TaxID=1149755 RepID=A0A2J6RRF9_HYAVF|nr:glycosyltransferase family 1 protein [Hyaloscypha variabilis F]